MHHKELIVLGYCFVITLKTILANFQTPSIREHVIIISDYGHSAAGTMRYSHQY
jgi:hypothetical protein